MPEASVCEERVESEDWLRTCWPVVLERGVGFGLACSLLW